MFMTADERQSWSARLLHLLPWRAERRPEAAPTSGEVLSITAPIEQRRDERWRNLIRPGTTVQASWSVASAGSDDQVQVVEGRVRAVFGETIWVWLERNQRSERCPEVDQSV